MVFIVLAKSPVRLREYLKLAVCLDVCYKRMTVGYPFYDYKQTKNMLDMWEGFGLFNLVFSCYKVQGQTWLLSLSS